MDEEMEESIREVFDAMTKCKWIVSYAITDEGGIEAHFTDGGMASMNVLGELLESLGGATIDRRHLAALAYIALTLKSK
jgi:hypothetical protein